MPAKNDAVDKLEQAWRRLARRWQESEQVWNDSVRRDFEKRYWTPLAQEATATRKQATLLAQVIARAQRSVQ